MNNSLLRQTALLLAALLWTSATAYAQLNLTTTANKLSEPGFEGDMPSYWTPSGADATWSSAQFRTAERSLALAGTGAADWTMDEVIRNWVPAFPGNTDLEFGAWVWTDGVNTTPASDDDKFQLVFSFRDAGGTDLLGAPVVVDLPQDQASSGDWVEVSTATVGAITLPDDAASATITFRKGSTATGTAYADDFFVRTTSATWPGDIFNPNVDVPGGWYYYWDGFPSGGDWPAMQSFAVTTTDAEAHTGSRSLRIEQLDPAASEAVGISERVPVTPGEPVLVSYWVKTQGNGDPATIGTGDNNVGLTALWYSQMESGPAGYGELGGLDIRLNGEYNPNVIPLLPQQADNGWTQYAFVLYPREDAVGMELRLRYWHSFTGVTWWDDVAIANVGGDALMTPVSIESLGGAFDPQSSAWLTPNSPNPFRGSTTIHFALPAATDVTIEVYDLRGRRVALVTDNQPMSAAKHEVSFEAGDLPSGSYLVVLRTSRHTEARMMTLVR